MHERYWSLTPYATEKLEERHEDSRIGYYDCPRLAKCLDHEVEQQLRDQIHETFPLVSNISILLERVYINIKITKEI